MIAATYVGKRGGRAEVVVGEQSPINLMCREKYLTGKKNYISACHPITHDLEQRVNQSQ